MESLVSLAPPPPCCWLRGREGGDGAAHRNWSAMMACRTSPLLAAWSSSHCSSDSRAPLSPCDGAEALPHPGPGDGVNLLDFYQGRVQQGAFDEALQVGGPVPALADVAEDEDGGDKALPDVPRQDGAEGEGCLGAVEVGEGPRGG